MTQGCDSQGGATVFTYGLNTDEPLSGIYQS